MRNADVGLIGLRQAGRNLIGCTGLVVLCALLVAAFAAPASAACPNEVFRNGPSAKLPECRAYELVTPAYTGGIFPSAHNFANFRDPFDYPLITDGGDSLIYNTITGPLTGTPGNGQTDRYVAKRTPRGWVTEFIGATAREAPLVVPGGISADHQYYFVQAGIDNNEFLWPDALLLAPFGGQGASYLRKPGGDFELIAKGSLGSARLATGELITPSATHIVFRTDTQLEPMAPPTGTEAIYDRTVGGPTHVVSLLPGDVTPTEGVTQYLGASEDANDIAFAQKKEASSFEHKRFYVRHANSSTQEVARSNGAIVGKELTCEGSGGTSLSYQWLRNGVPIGGATGSTYTVAAADEGEALQCQVRASSSEGESLQASLPPVVVAPYEGVEPPLYQQGTFNEFAIRVLTPQNDFTAVGEPITCEAGDWKGSPTYAYQWFRDGAEIAGATAATYTPVGADEQAGLQCRLTASNADGTAIVFSSVIPVHPAALVATADPTISNLTDPASAPEAGDELSCSQGTWSGSPTFSYQWLHDGVVIGGETASTYTVVSPADDGATLQCVVTGASGGVTTQAISNRLVAEPQPGTAPPEPNGFSVPGMSYGSGQVGEGLFCQAGEWSGEPTIGFQWLRDGSAIPGATEEIFVPAQADIGASVQCRVTATNAGGTTLATYAGASTGAHLITPAFPAASSHLSPMSLIYAGIFGGNVFYGDRESSFGGVEPGDLYSYSIADRTTTRITDVGDAYFSYVSKDGSRVYFLSESEIGGEGVDGEPNLYLWSRADGSTKFIATVSPEDRYQNGLGMWTDAVHPDSGNGDRGLGTAQIRESADGSTLLFTSSAQLSSFNNVEAAPEDCGDKFSSGEGCAEIYRYQLASGELTCVSCPPGDPGPATGAASLQGPGFGTTVYGPLPINAAANLMADGKTVFFQSTEDLLSQDGNQHQDVYRWKEGAGLALISSGQQPVESQIYAITPSGSDVAFLTADALVPEDQNGGTMRVYDARVNGGFPPPETAVTEPCSGDPCQGTPGTAPGAPGTPSASLNGGGNVHPKLRCPKGKRRVVRHGKQRCVKRGHHRKHKRRHAHANQGAAR